MPTIPNSYKLTKREQFIADNQDLTFANMAVQLNTSPYALERSYERMRLKQRKAKALAVLNDMRATRGLPPLTRVLALWWKQHQSEY